MILPQLRLLLPVLTLACGIASAGADVADLQRRLDAIEAERRTLPDVVASAQSQQRLGYHGFEADPAWVVINFGRVVTPEKIAIFPARLPSDGEGKGTGFPSSLEIDISESEDFESSIEMADWKESAPGAGDKLPFLIFEGNRASGQYLRVRVRGFRDDPSGRGRRYFRLGEIVVLENGQNAALKCEVSHTDAFVVARTWENSNLTDGYFWCQPLEGPGTSPTEGHQSLMRPDPAVNGMVWAEIDLGVRRPIDEVQLIPAHPKGLAYLPGYGFPTHFLVIADAGTPDEKVILKENSPPFPAEPGLPNPGASPVMEATPGLEARTIRVSCDALWRLGPSAGEKDASGYVFALSEIQCWHRGKNFAEGAQVHVSDGLENEDWSPAALVDGHSSTHPLLSWSAWLDGIGKGEALRLEADAIRTRIHLENENAIRRTRTLAMSLAGASVLTAGLALLFQQLRSKRKEEALRQRIARDLHDEIGASLSHLAMQGDLARRQLQRTDPAAKRLENLSASARETLDQMRDIIWLLAPKEGGDWHELSRRLQGISDRLLEGVAHEVTVRGEPPSGQPAIEWARDVVAFLKESLTNARKHAHASQVNVSIVWSDSLLLEIEDDGVGFDSKDAHHSSGNGLDNLRQRSTAMRATCDIDSTPGSGTRIRLQAPLNRR